jgi:hypothetical protein
MYSADKHFMFYKKLSTTHDVEQAPEEVETRVLNQLILRQEQRR